MMVFNENYTSLNYSRERCKCNSFVRSVCVRESFLSSSLFCCVACSVFARSLFSFYSPCVFIDSIFLLKFYLFACLHHAATHAAAFVAVNFSLLRISCGSSSSNLCTTLHILCFCFPFDRFIFPLKMLYLFFSYATCGWGLDLSLTHELTACIATMQDHFRCMFLLLLLMHKWNSIFYHFFSVVAFHLAYIYGVQNEFYYFWTGTHSMQRNTRREGGREQKWDREWEQIKAMQCIIIIVFGSQNFAIGCVSRKSIVQSHFAHFNLAFLLSCHHRRH